jgi:hypothetical protein
MRLPVITIAILLTTASASPAQDAVPDLKGTWTGTNKALVIGTSGHHGGSEAAHTAPPRISEVTFTFVVEGQEGRTAWGTLTSPNARERFVWAITHDNKTIIGSDRDGTFLNHLLEPNKLEICYTQADHHGKTSTVLVAVCHPFERKAR